MRLLIYGAVLLVICGVIGFDAFSKLSWPQVEGTVLSVDPKCEMKSEQYNVLTRTTSTATIDCQAVEAFKILHPDKEWTLRRTYLTHLLIGGPQPVKTTMVVYEEPAPKSGQVLKVIQDPKDSLRVLPNDTSFKDFGLAAIMGAISLLLLLWYAIRRGNRRPPMGPPSSADADPQGAQATTTSARATSFASRPAAGNAGGRVFGRR